MLNWRDPENPKAGGAERVSYAFLKGLLNRGHEIYWSRMSFPVAHKNRIWTGLKSCGVGGRAVQSLEQTVGIGNKLNLIW